MVAEVLAALDVRAGGTYVDATVGSGGHARAILERAGDGARLLGIDRDPDALGRARRNLARWNRQCTLVHGNFAAMADIAAGAGLGPVDGVLLDLGVSSDQLESADRGFSFRLDGPLDMRMDYTRGPTAAELIASLREDALGDLLRQLGEEPAARRIARAIVRERENVPITTSRQLTDIVLEVKGHRGRLNPATLTFQALRMAVNEELESLREGLKAGLELLRRGGRAAILSFQSLEDREVKHFLRRHVGRWESLAGGGREWVGEEPRVRLVNKKPVMPSESEIKGNPRGRSARLRAAERI